MKPALSVMLSLVASIQLGASTAAAAGPPVGDATMSTRDSLAQNKDVSRSAAEAGDLAFGHRLFVSGTALTIVAALITVLFAPKAPVGSIERPMPRNILIAASLVFLVVNLAFVQRSAEARAADLAARGVFPAEEPFLSEAAAIIESSRSANAIKGLIPGLVLGGLAGAVTLLAGFKMPGMVARAEERKRLAAVAPSAPVAPSTSPPPSS